MGGEDKFCNLCDALLEEQDGKLICPYHGEVEAFSIFLLVEPSIFLFVEPEKQEAPS